MSMTFSAGHGRDSRGPFEVPTHRGWQFDNGRDKPSQVQGSATSLAHYWAFIRCVGTDCKITGMQATKVFRKATNGFVYVIGYVKRLRVAFGIFGLGKLDRTIRPAFPLCVGGAY